MSGSNKKSLTQASSGHEALVILQRRKGVTFKQAKGRHVKVFNAGHPGFVIIPDDRRELTYNSKRSLLKQLATIGLTLLAIGIPLALWLLKG